MSEPKPALPGGLVIWIFVAVELLTFGAFLAAFAHAYKTDEAVFRASQNMLHPGMGTINTGVLLTGSWLVARALIAKRATRWLIASGLSGVIFLGIKTYEYSDVFAHGVSMSTNGFWFYYLFLTLMHYLHVVFGIGVMFWLGWRSRDDAGVTRLSLEAGAIYWHLVDLIWIVLFPTLYLMHVQ